MDQPKILVVEDNPVEQRVIAVIASRCGYAVDLCGTAYKALELLQNDSEYVAVLMNYVLPAMNGPECAQRIREFHNAAKHVPIIAVTAYPIDHARETCLNAGMDDYLGKPYSIEEFESMLSRWADKSAKHH